jgi:hypothetical protein
VTAEAEGGEDVSMEDVLGGGATRKQPAAETTEAEVPQVHSQTLKA